MKVSSSAPLLVSLLASAAMGLALPACGSTETTAEPLDDGSVTPNDTLGETAGDATTAASLRIEPAEILLTVKLDGTSTSAAIKVFEKATPGAPEVDVTAEASLSISEPTLATIDKGTIGKATRGGIATITATTARVTSPVNATLKVKLIGDAFLAGTDDKTKTAIEAAKPGADPAKAPLIEYPLDASIVPRNVPPMEVQWTASGDGSGYRVTFRAADVLDVAIFAKTREALLAAPQWSTLIESAAGGKAQIVVDALEGTTLHTSTPVVVTVARDRIDDTSIFYWESSSGSMKVLDFATSKLVTLPVTGSAWAPGSPSKCVACHTVSRDGTRFAYTSGSIELGTLVANAEKTSFVAAIEPGTKVTPGFRWTHGVFNPKEAATRPALLVTKADLVGNNAPGHVRLALIDPDVGAEIPSNLTDWLAGFPAGMPRDLLQPDWSNSGIIVFNAYDSELPNPDPTGAPKKAWVRLLGDDSVGGSIVEATVEWDAVGKKFTFGAPKVIVPAKPGASLDVAETNVLPQISPDETLVAFSRLDGWWPVKYQDPAVINVTGRIAIVRRADGKVIELSKANGPPKSDVTQPQWAPTIGSDYAWLAFSAERPYGHRMNKSTPLPGNCFAGTGMTLCKNMWITAIDLKAAKAGEIDPSNVPFWMPGQTALASAVSPRWTKTAVKIAK